MTIEKNAIIIQKATKNDLIAIYQMVNELAIFEKEPEAVSASLLDYTKGFENGVFDAYMAFEGNLPVGMALFYTTFSTWKGRMLYLEDFYVKPTHRSKGVGQLLFDKFVAHAKSTKCKMVKWEVINWNKDAIRFYKKNGATIEDFWWDGKIIF